MTDFVCQICHDEEHSEWRRWKTYVMCIACHDYITALDAAYKEKLRKEFFEKHKEEPQ